LIIPNYVRTLDLYQLALQASVTLIAQFRQSLSSDAINGDDKDAISAVLGQIISKGGTDGIWICNAIASALRLHSEVSSDSRMFRVPPTLVDAAFVSKLRNGASLRALGRLSFLSRLNKITKTALDTIIQGESNDAERFPS